MKELHALAPEKLTNIVNSRLDSITTLKKQAGNENLFFSGTYAEHPPLTLRFSPPVITEKLAFRLDDAGPLALGGIAYTTANAATAKAVLVLGDSGAAEAIDLAGALPPDTDMFTTQEGQPPCAYLLFAEPVELASLTVINRQRQLWRNHGLSVSYTDARSQEYLLFAHRPLVTAFMHAFEASRSEYTGDATLCAAVKKLDTILLTLIYDAAPKTMSDLSIEDIALLTTIKLLVSQKIFFPREREITSHGIVRSFRFWSEKERINYLKDACDIIAALEQISPYVSFAYGSVLGFVREASGHIPHDTDHDLVILFPEGENSTYEDAYILVERHLTALGMELRGRDTNMLCTKVAGKRSGTTIDIFPGFYDEQGLARAHPTFLGKYLRLVEHFPVAKAHICGVACPIPHNAVDYLGTLFGKHWRTPLNSCFTAEHNSKLILGD
ncbi:hypothetical protein LJC46_01880 [Desulfovibrio sp. OttesenSCG-928-G15]|nr:hypothetical protein [Desulfovibrio sp. OttesenSCG-928-G15]